MRAFVTGLDGFVGQWLVRALMASRDDVAGGSRTTNPSYNILTPDEAARLTWFPLELRDGAGLSEAIRSWRPDAVFHLAAQASVRAAMDDPAGTIDANVIGTARLMEACRACAPDASILYVGSAEAYGEADPSELPLSESTPLRPTNPYAASKAAAEIVAMQYARAGALRVVATRSFNHTGPGQRTTFALPAFAQQIADIEIGNKPPVIRVGNLSPRRDFTDVRDVVRAYRLLAERGQSGTAYNVCSGRSVSMREALDELLRIAGVEVSVEVDTALTRPVDTPDIVGDYSLLRRDTGWEPEVPLATTLRDLLAWHRAT
jgi:GDP-4-dehydro-6-deoxy-D-mannose reductase